MCAVDAKGTSIRYPVGTYLGFEKVVNSHETPATLAHSDEVEPLKILAVTLFTKSTSGSSTWTRMTLHQSLPALKASTTFFGADTRNSDHI